MTAGLSERELQILRLVAEGLSNRQIAGALDISENTVKVHVRNIFAKINVASRTEASLFAVRSGVVVLAPHNPDPPAAPRDPELTPTPIPAGDQLPSSTTPAQLVQSENPETAAQPQLPRVVSRRRVLLLAATAGAAVLGVVAWQARNSTPTPAAVTPPAPALSRWHALPGLPQPRAGVVLVVVDGALVALGGAGASTRVDRYDQATDSWRAQDALPFPLQDAVAWSDGAGVVVADNGAQCVRFWEGASWRLVAYPGTMRITQVVRWQGQCFFLIQKKAETTVWRYATTWEPLPLIPAQTVPAALVAADRCTVFGTDGTVWTYDEAAAWQASGSLGSAWNGALGYGVLGSVLLLQQTPDARIALFAAEQQRVVPQAELLHAVRYTQALAWRSMVIYADGSGSTIDGYQVLYENFVPIAQ